jgi:hypothetical protein
MSQSEESDAIKAVKNLIRAVSDSTKSPLKKNLNNEKKYTQCLLEKLLGRKVKQEELENALSEV